MPEEILENLKKKMTSSRNVLQKELAGIRTGRASAGLLESISIDYYGTPTPISQVATIATPESRSITVQPWDISQLQVIEKAIQSSDIGINPSNDGKIIRLELPPMTEERRKELAKLAKKLGEESKIAIRNIRRDGMDTVKKRLKAKELSEDDEKGLEIEIQKITDGYIKDVDTSVASKEKEILET
jgi:ribosome recycling factor